MVLVFAVVLWTPEVLPKSETVLSVEVVLADIASQNPAQYLEALPAATNPNAESQIGELHNLLPLSQPAPALATVNVDSATATSTGAPNLDAGAMIQPTGSTGFFRRRRRRVYRRRAFANRRRKTTIGRAAAARRAGHDSRFRFRRISRTQVRLFDRPFKEHGR